MTVSRANKLFLYINIVGVMFGVWSGWKIASGLVSAPPSSANSSDVSPGPGLALLSKVRVGMPDSTVISMLGEPDFRISWSNNSGDYLRLEWKDGQNATVAGIFQKTDGDCFSLTEIDLGDNG